MGRAGKLLDFGIARLIDRNGRDDALTRTGTEQRAYTPAYAAPEQIAGGALSTATDLYALGVILHELLTGERPWPSARDDAAVTEAPSRRLALRTPIRRWLRCGAISTSSR
jgi:serine/threonine-protein kinase